MSQDGADAPLTRGRHQLVVAHLPKIRRVAHSVSQYLGVLSYDEFVSIGYESLTRAAARYDPDTGVPFWGYAYYRVRGAMIDAVRSRTRNRRRIKRAAQTMAMSQSAAELMGNHFPAASDDPRSLDERVYAAAELIRQTTAAVVLNHITAGPDIIESAPDPDATPPDDQVLAVEQREVLHQVLHEVCTPDERRLLDDLYTREQSMHSLKEAYGVSVSTISRRHARVLRKLALHLRARFDPDAPMADPEPGKRSAPKHKTSDRGPP